MREEQARAGNDTSLQVAAEQVKQYNQGLVEAKAALAALATPEQGGFDAIAQDIAAIVAELTGLASEGKKAKDIIGALVADLDLTPLQTGAQTAADVVGGLRAEVEVTVTALQALADNSTLSATVITEQLGAALAKLSGEELLNFQQQAVAAFADSKDKAEELALALDTTLTAQP